MKIVAFIVGCLLFGVADLLAQESSKDLKTLAIVSQPLPDGKLITLASDSARWIITSTIVPDPSATPQPATAVPKPAVLTVTKSGKSYLVETVAPDGRKLVRWKDSQFQATYPGGETTPLISYNPGSIYYLDFSNSDFPEFSWISAHNYVGVTKLGAVTGLVFKASIATQNSRMGLLTMPHPTPADAIAVVDAATRKPVMLQVDNEILIYQFSASSADVSLPPEVQQAFAALRKQIQRASLVPPG